MHCSRVIAAAEASLGLPEVTVGVIPAAGGTPKHVSTSPTALAWAPDGKALWQVRRGEGKLELWAAEVDRWQFRKLAPIPLPTPPGVHAEHLPLTVDPRSGEVVVIHRSIYGELMLFSGIDERAW